MVKQKDERKDHIQPPQRSIGDEFNHNWTINHNYGCKDEKQPHKKYITNYDDEKDEFIEKEFDLEELLDFANVQDIHQDTLNQMSIIIKDVCQRTSSGIVKELSDVLLQYYHRISTDEFDIGRITGIECEMPVKQ